MGGKRRSAYRPSKAALCDAARRSDNGAHCYDSTDAWGIVVESASIPNCHDIDLAGLVSGRAICDWSPEAKLSEPGPSHKRRGNTMIRRVTSALALAAVSFPLFAVAPHAVTTSDSQVLSREIRSANFEQNKIGVTPIRKVLIYLPAGSERTSVRFPVIYFLPTPFEGYQAPFDKHGSRELFDRAIQAGVIDKFVLVCIDMTTPVGSSWYVNSPVTGNWEDYVIEELVPYMDKTFRTLANRNSRGIVGDFMGGYGALRFGMTHPEIFGAVYALHPVGTGSGVTTMYSRPNWETLANAKSLDDLGKEVYSVSRIFTSIYQAHLPNPSKPPLYIDFQAHDEGGTLTINSAVTARLRDNFFIESLIPKYADNLKSLRGLKMDWARSDPNQDHVYANQALTRKLNEFGIAHEAEEYNGVWGTGNWGETGRIFTEVLPFFQRNLAFSARSE
jgi:pimeloyl-ACP methyl ester carboxylesterase